MLMFLGSFITLMKLINKRNKQKSDIDYTVTTYWYMEDDCSSSDSGNSSDCDYYGDYSSSSDCSS